MTDQLQTIRMGVKARDLVTGMEGIINQRVENLYRGSQWSLQPQRKETDETGKYPDAWGFDENGLQYLDEGIANLAVAPDESIAIQLGDDVEDTITGYRGVATSKVTYLNGCVRFAVVQKVVHEKDKGQIIPKPEHFDHKQLRVVQRDPHRQLAPVRQQAATGGPPEKVTW